MKKTIVFLLISAAAFITPVFADWKLTQKMKMGDGGGASRITTIYQKGVRQRHEDKIDMGKDAVDPETAAMMEQMGMSMPTLPFVVNQCDLKQDIFINEKNKSYFIDYYDWSSLPPDKLVRRPNQKMVVKGTMTTDTVVVDSGKRQQMFGLTAKWLKVTMTSETSADSCDGASSTKFEQEGWFANLSLDGESCPVRIPPNTGGCRPKVIVKRMANPGFMLTGTVRMFEGSKVTGTFEYETTELSKATLDQSLFEVPVGFTEVDSLNELNTKRSGPVDTSARTVFTGDASGPRSKVKTIAIDFFSGNASKLDQMDLRSYISSKVTAAGMSGFPVNSQADIAGGSFANVIGVEVTKIKESGASKLGGLFGKVSGTADAAKIGNTSAEIVMTIYGKDGKTAVASATGQADIKGGPNDAVKAAIDRVIDQLLAKIK